VRRLSDEQSGSVIPVLLYLIGLVIFGFTYWLMNGILDIFKDTGIADTTTYTVYPFLIFIWVAIIVLYVILGGIWLMRTYNENNYMYGGM